MLLDDGVGEGESARCKSEVLELKPGMTVAAVGSGFGAMTVVLGHWIGPARVFATDSTDHALRQTREYVKQSQFNS